MKNRSSEIRAYSLLLLILTVLIDSVPTYAKTKTQPCTDQLQSDFSVLSSGWSRDLAQTQNYTLEQTGLESKQLNSLEEQWSFVFTDTVHPRSVPAISRQAIFLGSQEGRVFALSKDSGCEFWSFQAAAEVRTAISLAQVNGQWLIFFGDLKANVYALDAYSGSPIWQQRAHNNSQAIITGSPVYHDERLYVPVSSLEVKAAINPFYPCCHFRGALVALDATSGKVRWRFNTIKQEAQPTYKNIVQTQLQGPSGAAIWSAPTIDVKRKRLYVGTGQNYSYPATAMSDAIIAIDMNTGHEVWVQQTVSNDIWNPACMVAIISANCPKQHGQDYDFGAPPVLATRSDGREVILAGQKSGMLFAMDPDNSGSVIWQKSLGRGGLLGGIHWGIAASRDAVYAPVSDIDVPFILKYPDQPQSGLNKINIYTGDVIWHTPAFFNCRKVLDWGFGCRDGLSQAITVMPGAILAGGLDGVLRAYDENTGEVIWQFDTKQESTGVNGIKGEGGTLDAGAVVVADGQLFFNSGYGGLMSVGGDAGNVFRVLSLPRIN